MEGFLLSNKQAFLKQLSIYVVKYIAKLQMKHKNK